MPFDVLDRIVRPLGRRPVTAALSGRRHRTCSQATRGLPMLDTAPLHGEAVCAAVCPTGASPVSDAWTSMQAPASSCGACERPCPQGAIDDGRP